MGFTSAMRYALAELEAHATDTMWWRGRIVDRINSPFQRKVFPGYDGATRVMDADWDNLFVLDGCRADLFESTVDLDRYDHYTRVLSLGSTTEEWTRNNFADERFGDTVYVTSNPYTTKTAGGSFHQLVNVWETAFDEESRTVHPEPLVEEALAARERYPEKRIVVHFMQPHYPFVGSNEFTGAGMNPEGVMDGSIGGSRKLTAWRALERGEVSAETVWRAYRDNLEYVLAPVEELVSDLGGKTVVTADHGNMIGERSFPVPIRLYGHPGGLRHDPLVSVPWAEVVVGERRTVTEDEVTLNKGDRSEIAERLRDLGYAE